MYMKQEQEKKQNKGVVITATIVAVIAVLFYALFFALRI